MAEYDDHDGEETDENNGNEPASSPDPNVLGDEFKFKDPEPKPKKKKSRLEQLGIPTPERRELTEEEQRKTKELASEFKSCIETRTSVDPWKGFDTGAAF